MEDTATEEVSPAFEILLESVESEVSKLNDLGSEAFKKRDYSAAKGLADQAEKFATFRMKVLALSSEWEKLKAAAAPPPRAPKGAATRKNLGKLRKGMRTPETAFYLPILEVLVDLGGGGEMNKVLDKVHPKVAALLKPVDLQPLASGPKTNLRWRNTAQWARNTLKEHGYLKSDSPHGVWEVTTAGRNWLQKARSAPGPISL
jgi:restriction system protein